MYLSNMDYLITICIIYFLSNWGRVGAIQGDNVRDATENEFPFVVAISDEISGTDYVQSKICPVCTGTLITRKHVLTAVHCLPTEQVENLKILVGSINLSQCLIYQADKWTTYKEWKFNNSRWLPQYYYDVAVITLKNCIDMPNMRLVVVPKFKPKNLFGASVKIAGWGLTNGNMRTEILRTVDLKVLSDTECNTRVSQILKKPISTDVFIRHLCATSEPWALNTCGDSGGPLLNERNELIGITVGTSPSDETILETYPRQVIDLNRLMEQRVNLHASLHFYQDFVASFTAERRRCSIS